MRKLAVLLLFSLQACVTFPPADANNRECVPRAGEVAPDKKLRPTGPLYDKTIWYTDDGEFVDRCAFSDAMYELQSKGAQIVVVYVHGWKHDGDPEDTDLKKFKEQLSAIRELELEHLNPRRVVGLYVAWNGRRTNLRLAKELTFWGRKRAADRVSQSAAVTRLLSAIDSIREQRAEPRDLTIHVGHSFGARILYNAVAQGLVRQTELAHPGPGGGNYKMIRGFGDIVILLNPAFEASLFTTFDSVRRKEYPFDPHQPPLLISISSETDRATRVAFPVGQFLHFDRAPKRRVTLGNFNDYVSHNLVARTPGETRSDAEWCSKTVCMIGVAGRPQDNVPFINARAERTVIDGHNDVWNENLSGFIAHVITDISSRGATTDIATTATADRRR